MPTHLQGHKQHLECGIAIKVVFAVNCRLLGLLSPSVSESWKKFIGFPVSHLEPKELRVSTCSIQKTFSALEHIRGCKPMFSHFLGRNWNRVVFPSYSKPIWWCRELTFWTMETDKPETSSFPRSLWRTFLASSIRPLLTSHRGDSGKKNTASKRYPNEGPQMTPSIDLQLGDSFNDIANTKQYARNIPPDPTNWGIVFRSPRISDGAVSEI